MGCAQTPSRGHNVSEIIDLNSPEGKAAMQEAIEKATAPLVAKRDELLGEVKKLRKGQEIDPAELERVEGERDKYKSDLAEANKLVKKATADAEAANKRATDAEGFTSKLLVDNGLTDALVKAGVTNPVHQKAAKAMLAGQVQITDDNGAKVPKLGDKALAEAITEWAGTDEGKFFVTAPDANGGGAGNHGANKGAPAGDMGGDKAARLARAEQLLKQNAE